MAYGYLINNTTVDLFGNISGLGLFGNPNNSITNNEFIQLDLNNLITNVPYKTIPYITITGLQTSEGFSIYGTNILNGVLGNLIYQSNDLNLPNLEQTLPIPNFGEYKYIQITASGIYTSSNILLTNICFLDEQSCKCDPCICNPCKC